MARPKLNAPKKQKLTLTVSEQARTELDFVSRHHGQSISALVEQWVAKEAKVIAKKAGDEIPQANQMNIEEFDEQKE